jgi:DNA-binding MarR family transcriptional regulator
MGALEQHLVALGFSEYEARAWVGLARHGPLTGYELAKRTGVPRANVYAVLSRLEQRGAVVRAVTPDGQRYAAIPGGELLRRLAEDVDRHLEAAAAALAGLGAPREEALLWNVQGRAAALAHAREQVRASRTTLWIANAPPEAAELGEEIRHAHSRGVHVETLCLDACPQECGGCKGTVYRYRVPPERGGRWLVVVRDGEELFAAEIRGDGECAGVRTTNPLFVQLVTWYMRYSAALGRALEEVGIPREEMTSVEGVLKQFRRRGQAPRWLEHLGRVLRRGSAEGR